MGREGEVWVGRKWSRGKAMVGKGGKCWKGGERRQSGKGIQKWERNCGEVRQIGNAKVRRVGKSGGGKAKLRREEKVLI